MLKLSLHSKSVPVEIEHPDKSVKSYTLREMTAGARDRYMDSLKGRMGPSTDGSNKVTLTKYEGFQIDLLKASLFDDQNKPVEEAVLREWPAAAVHQLYEESQKLNNLGGKEDKKDEPEKNG